MFIPSIKISPEFISYSRSIKLNVVLFPQPDSPTIAIFLPGSIKKFKSSKTTFLVLSCGYINLTFLNSILPLKSSLEDLIPPIIFCFCLYLDNKIK